MTFKKGMIGPNLGRKLDIEWIKNLSIGHKNQTPWNRGIYQESICLNCGDKFIHHCKKRGRDFCSRKCYIENAKLTCPHSSFKKGIIPWNKGRPMSDEIKSKLSLSLKGRKSWNKGIKGFNKGHIVTLETREKIRNKNKGKVRTEENKKKISISRTGKCMGEKHHNWMGGKSFEPYGLDFNNKLKKDIRKRDNFACQECGFTENQLGYKLSIHHIDYNKKNNNKDNLIALCKSCHAQTSYNRIDWINYFQGKMGGNDGLL